MPRSLAFAVICAIGAFGPVHAQTAEDFDCALAMQCTGAWDACTRATGPAQVQLREGSIIVTAMGDTFHFDEVTPDPFATGARNLTASGLRFTPAPARSTILLLSDDRLGVIVSEDPTNTGQFHASLSFAADCPAP
ncbi:hypothetical protein [Gymnodinialimonas ulvae]|uniref:hypothetical protein n=1 Tax=Gymnodinialimonas ulvae TaxID=3126504 RepID=UPI0030AD7776